MSTSTYSSFQVVARAKYTTRKCLLISDSFIFWQVPFCTVFSEVSYFVIWLVDHSSVSTYICVNVSFQVLQFKYSSNILNKIKSFVNFKAMAEVLPFK